MKYTIREMMKELTGLTDLQWGGYAFYHEPLERKFTPEQKDGNNQIWIDMYALTSFLQKNRAKVEKTDDGEYRTKRCIVPMGFQD